MADTRPSLLLQQALRALEIITTDALAIQEATQMGKVRLGFLEPDVGVRLQRVITRAGDVLADAARAGLLPSQPLEED